MSKLSTQPKWIGIDPGTHHGAYAVWDAESRKIIKFGDIENDELLVWLRYQDITTNVCCETIQSYGQAVGAETFETCFFIGRVQEICFNRGQDFLPIKRKEVILQHCCAQKATDSQVRKAMIDYVGEPGKRKTPGPTFGISGHVWSALAIATYYPVKTETELRIQEMREARGL